MLNRMSALWLVIGALGAYAIAGASVTAQNAPESPRLALVLPGDEVTLHIDWIRDITTVRCAVAEVHGIWIRCASRDKFAIHRQETWFSLERVIQMDKHQK